MQPLSRTKAVCAALGLALVLAGPAPADAQTNEPIDLDIPAQSLDQAITELARQSGLSIGGDATLLRGRQAPSLRGEHTPRAALQTLLSGTGVTYRFTGPDTVILERAGASQGDAARLGPITVTGEKTVRTLQDTAASVSVLTGEDLEDSPGTATLDNAITRLPNVVGTGTGNFAPSIRGVDTTGPANGVFAFLGGVRPRVTIQQDGRPLTFNELVYGQTGLWDAERVEVLRGPQTTLQGRNSIAGAIIYDTRDPTFEYESKVRGIAGDYDTRQLSGVVSGPIVEDELAFRLSADTRRHESFVELTDPSFVDDPRQEEATNIRGKLLWLPEALPELSAKLTLNHSDARRPQSEIVSPPFEKRVLDNSTPGMFPVFDNQADSSILDLSYVPGPDVELRNTTTYSKIDIARLTEPGNGIVDIDAEEFSNELVMEYDTPGMHALFGTYYFNSNSDEEIDIGGGVFDDSTETASLFGEGTMTFFDSLDVTLGARYEREHRQRSGSAAVFVIDLDDTFEAFLPKAGVAYRPNERLTWGANVQRGWNAGGAGIAFVEPFPSFTYEEESVWNYEGFFRSSWLKDRLTVNGNVFYADYEDQQRLALLDPTDPASGVIRNAEATESYGAELTTTWLPAPELELSASLGLVETSIESFPASAEDAEGNEFARAPNVTASLGALYRHDSGLELSVDGQYVDGYFSEDDNDPVAKVDAYTLVNAQVSYEVRNVRLFAFMTNVFDRDDEVLVFSGNGQVVDPREYGIGLEARF